MGKIREDLDGGLTDGPDPSWLKPGQLSYLQNATYEPNSSALKRAKGRTAFGTATASASTVNGIRDANFDNSAGHYLIAQISGAVPAYVTAFVGATGAFGVLTGITAGSTMDIIQHNNRFFLLNGVSGAALSNSNTVMYLSSTAASSAPQIRQHGMIPVVSPPGITTAASAFSLSDAGASGYYEYWTTEVARFIQDGSLVELEGTFGAYTTGTAAGSDVATVFVSSTSVAPVIKIPGVANSITTHWRIYRSPKKQFSTDKEFPSGFVIATLSTASGQIVDTIATASGSFVFEGSENSGTQYSDFVSASAARSANGVYASATGFTVGVYDPGTGFRKHFQQQGYYGFSFGGFKGFIHGIEVEMTCYTTSTVGTTPGMPVMVGLFKRGSDGKYGGGPYAWRTGYVTATSPGQVVTVGSSADRWVPPDQNGFNDSDFDTNLMAVVQVENKHFALDYIKIKPYYGLGTTEGSTVPFPTVVYTFGDISAQVGKNGLPPSADTGDIYEDCLVLNDKSNPSLVRYSFPGSPEYFPATYFIDFETPQNDVVTFIKVVNNRLLVGLNTSVWRANYLPSERDASFDRGKAIEPLTRSYGCINPMCVCTFSRDNSTEMLAWVSQKGIHITDGFSFDTMTTDLEWRNILSLTSTSQAISLINDPENLMLKFLYRNDALAEPYKELQLSYRGRKSDSSQTENLTQLTIAGQVAMRNVTATPGAATANPASMWAVPRDNGDTSIYIGYGSSTAAGGGQVYIESGSTIPAADPVMGFKTRRMFLAGEGKEVEIHTVYGHIGSNAATAGIDMKALNIKTNDDAGQVTVASNTIAFGGRKIGKWQLRAMTEGLVLSAAVTGTPQQDLSWDYLLVEGEDFGEEDSGK